MKFFLTTVFFLLFGLGCFAVVSHPCETETVSKRLCNQSNYLEYIYDPVKTDKLIEETGRGCFLRYANFSGKKFYNAIFREAELCGAVFVKAGLTGVDFRGADLRRALFGTNFLTSGLAEQMRNIFYFLYFQEGMNLSGAQAYDVDFRGADLRGTNLDRIVSRHIDWRGAFYDEETNFPGSDSLFNAKEKGMIYRL